MGTSYLVELQGWLTELATKLAQADVLEISLGSEDPVIAAHIESFVHTAQSVGVPDAGGVNVVAMEQGAPFEPCHNKYGVLMSVIHCAPRLDPEGPFRRLDWSVDPALEVPAEPGDG